MCQTTDGPDAITQLRAKVSEKKFSGNMLKGAWKGTQKETVELRAAVFWLNAVFCYSRKKTEEGVLTPPSPARRGLMSEVENGIPFAPHLCAYLKTIQTTKLVSTIGTIVSLK